MITKVEMKDTKKKDTDQSLSKDAARDLKPKDENQQVPNTSQRSSPRSGQDRNESSVKDTLLDLDVYGMCILK